MPDKGLRVRVPLCAPVEQFEMGLTLNPKIEVRQSAIEGKGLFAKEPFKRGERFKATCGEAPSVVMTEKEFEAYKQTVDS